MKLFHKIGSIRLVIYFFRAYPARSALMIVCLLFASLAEGISILSLIPMMDIIQSGGSGTGSGIGVFFKKALDHLGLHPTLPTVLLVFIAGIAVKGLFMLVAMKQVGYTVAHVTSDLRIKLVNALMNANWNYFINRPAGYFSNAMGSEAMRASTAYHHTALFLASALNALLYVILAMVLSIQTTIIAALAAAMMIVMFSTLIRKSRRAGFRQTELMKSIISRLTDALQGIKSIKAMARENHFQNLLESETRDLYRAQKSQVFATEALKAVQEPFLAILIASIVYLIITFGSQSFSSLIVMLLIFQRLLSKIYTAQSCYQEMAVGESALWSLIENIEKAEIEVDQYHHRGEMPRFNHCLCMNSVNFAYGRKTILKDVSIKIPIGIFAAIIGPSGSGKTTLVDLIAGLFVPQSGDICVDDVPLRKLDIFAWRRMIGYVPQEIFLFHETVSQNISLGDRETTDREIEEALASAGALDFVSKLPSGIHTVIGERGSKLSGGQRQRIAIARALLHKPKLLILDEATTALDPKTEEEICETLKRLAGSTTIIAISHQSAIARVADQVFKIRKGCLFEEQPVREMRGA